MKQIHFLISISILLATTPSFSQQRNKLTKNEKILELAYNDTTRALAFLFTHMREVTNDQSTRALKGIVISSGVALVGGAIMASNPDSGVIVASGLTPLLIGTGGILVFSSTWLISKLRKNPYTVKKFEKLITLCKEGKTIPVFYLQRMEKYPY
jgi:hypothetical protein